MLDPRDTWADKDAYDAQARKLAGDVRENFQQFADSVTAEVRAGGLVAPIAWLPLPWERAGVRDSPSSEQLTVCHPERSEGSHTAR